eukprot:4335577-Lingulodinium_polyedra.AAC.1
MLKPALRHAIRELLVPPAALRGRVAGLRLRTAAEDVMLLACYAPAYGSLAPGLHGKAVEAMVRWADRS